MATNIDFVLDSSGKGILSNAGSVQGNVAPILFRNDTYNMRVRVVDVVPQTGAFSDSLLATPSFKIGIGEIDAKPTSGDFRLTLSGPVTSGNIPHNATTTQVLNAVSGIAGNVTVTTFGVESNAWVIQAATANTALSFGGVAYTLFPTSSVQISTRRNPGTDTKAEQVISLKRSPAIYSDSFAAASTAGVVSLTKIQDGDSTKDETYLLVVGQEAVGGSFNIAYGSNSSVVTVSGLSSWNASAVQTALNSITGLSRSNIFASNQYSGNKFTIQFYGSLGRQNITTALSIDASGVEFAKYYESAVTMATSELDAIFSGTSANTKTLTLEIEMTDAGSVKTLGQKSITVRRDLVSTGNAVPSPQSSYYTKAEADAIFVEDSTSNVDATNRRLKNSGGTTIVDYGSALFGASGMVNLSSSAITIGAFPVYINSSVTATGAVSFGGGMAVSGNLGFYGTSPIAKPSGPNVVSNVISLGLISSSATYGVLPGSIKTITTSVTLTFGVVPANDTTSVSTTITGSNINDIVLLGLPNSLCAGLSFYGHVTTADVVEIDAVNGINSSRTQSAQTYRVTVIGY